MKKTFMALTLASLFMAGASQAQDHSATVTVHCSIVGDHTECTVYTAQSTVTLNGQLADLPIQGQMPQHLQRLSIILCLVKGFLRR